MVLPPQVQSPVNLAEQLLERGYESAAGQVIRAISQNSTSGLIAQRLGEFEAEASRLTEAGQPLTITNPVLRALLADLDDTLTRDALLIDSAAERVQGVGIDAAGQIVRQMALALPDDMLTFGARWNTPDPVAVAQAVQYASSDAWAAELDRYQVGTRDSVLQAVIRGIVSGQNPLVTAEEVRGLVEGMPAFRANNLLRTLQLQSYRAASTVNRMENSNILAYQIRIASLDSRCCMACVALHGTQLPIDATIDDHHQGRCDSIAVTRGRERDIQSGDDWFGGLDPDRQRAQMGNAAYEAWRRGDIQLRDFVQPYRDPVFGQMIREASLRGMLAQPNRMVRTLSGDILADRGRPGATLESLTTFVENSNGPLAQALNDFERPLVGYDNSGQLIIRRENVRDAARLFVSDSQKFQYGRDYLVSLAQQQAAENGVILTLNQTERLVNQQYATQARAIQLASNVGNVRLTEAQRNRLQRAVDGDYLDMVYLRQNSEWGSLRNQLRQNSLTGLELEQARQNYRDWILGLD